MKNRDKTMILERYLELDKAGKGLTEEEIEAGWHFCLDWDGMLVGPGMPEVEGCICNRRKERWNENHPIREIKQSLSGF